MNHKSNHIYERRLLNYIVHVSEADVKTANDDVKEHKPKTMYSIADLVGPATEPRTSKVPPEEAQSAFQIHNSRALQSYEFWKQQQFYFPSMYTSPLTSSPYDHVPVRQMTSALSLRCHGDPRFCSSWFARVMCEWSLIVFNERPISVTLWRRSRIPALAIWRDHIVVFCVQVLIIKVNYLNKFKCNEPNGTCNVFIFPISLGPEIVWFRTDSS